jgi:hypothetical protein
MANGLQSQPNRVANCKHIHPHAVAMFTLRTDAKDHRLNKNCHIGGTEEPLFITIALTWLDKTK